MIWRPIETAPHDGTWVLLFDPSVTEGGMMGCGKYEHGSWWTWTLDDHTGQLFDEPTHWLPLPDPPESSPLERLDRLAEELDSLYND